MKLLTQTIKNRLLQNGERSTQQEGTRCARTDFIPVVKLFTPDANCTWFLTEIDPEDEDLAFGLCDLGIEFPEVGTVRISELEKMRGPLGLPVERDRHFRTNRTLSEYANEATGPGLGSP